MNLSSHLPPLAAAKVQSSGRFKDKESAMQADFSSECATASAVSVASREHETVRAEGDGAVRLEHTRGSGRDTRRGSLENRVAMGRFSREYISAK